MALTYTQANAMLDALLGSTVYLGLSTADPSRDASGLAEPAAGGYARVEVLSSVWNAAAEGAKDNASTITFPTPSGSWGIPLYLTIHDSSSGGNLLAYGTLNNPQAVGTGSTPPTFVAGTVRVQA